MTEIASMTRTTPKSWDSRLVLMGSVLFVTLGLMLTLSPVRALAAEDTHLFDPVLSLTGDCTTSSTDLVPDPSCPGGPTAGAFDNPIAITTDAYGNMFVANGGEDMGKGAGSVTIFNAAGEFLTELSFVERPTALAIDSQGTLYVARDNELSPERVVRYSPIVYQPQLGNIQYNTTPTTIFEAGSFLVTIALTVNPSNDHLLLNRAESVEEYGSAAEGNPLLEVIDPEVSGQNGIGLAIDESRELLYVTSFNGPSASIKVLELYSPHSVVQTIDGSTRPDGKFVSFPSIAIDESTGHVFAYDHELRKVYEFTQSGSYVSTLERKFQPGFPYPQIGIDNGSHSPNGALNPDGRYVFVPSQANGHVYAFAPKAVPRPPVIESVSVSGVTADEALLEANVHPKGQETHYRFEYMTLAAFEEEEGSFTNATVADEGMVDATINEGKAVSAYVAGLLPGTSYRFRVVAENESGQDEADGGYETYFLPDVSSNCGNEDLRTGASASLPDCRAYELVSPADTNGHAPLGFTPHNTPSPLFDAPLAAADGNQVSFRTMGGAIPGLGGTGAFFGDPYLSTRNGTGWTTGSAGPSGLESVSLLAGSRSADQGYSFWRTGGPGGSASIEGKSTSYVRHSDGHSEVLGQGSLGVDAEADGQLISENGEHVIFGADVKLEEDAAPTGTRTLYDRTSDGITHVISLLPNDVPVGAGKNALYAGSSADGKGVAFEIGTTLYLRIDNAATFEVSQGGAFAGIADGGERIFYREGGDLFAFDPLTDTRIPFTESGDATVVNIARGGTVAYFVSPTKLTADENPSGATAAAGAKNLYRSEEGEISFVGTVSARDVAGDPSLFPPREGLGLWLAAVSGRGLAIDPSRTTADGDVLLFEARANLADYDAGGDTEVYRYDFGGGTLDCLSCLHSGGAENRGASLQSFGAGGNSHAPIAAYDEAGNLREDGERVFFEAEDELVLGDTDGLRDVYEWEEEGVGSCRTPSGCIYLISSGGSAEPDYLYATSANGDDVFISTADLLLPDVDPDGTPSIYDARVEGGFPPQVAASGECLGEACQPAAVAPNDATPASSSFQGSGNVKSEGGKRRARCPKGKRLAKRNAAKARCVPVHKKRRNRPGANAKGRTQR